MSGGLAHRWDLSAAAAIALQKSLAGQVERADRLGPGGRRAIRYVAGVDVAFEEGGAITRAAVVVLRRADLVTVESAVVRRPTRFPYVPGLLSFREVPAILAALAALSQRPDLLLCDGQGLAHPRRFGLACHLGLLADLPAIGVAKSRLIGAHAEPGPAKGDWVPLMAPGKTGGRAERIGAVLRSRAGVKPLYVSIGHRVSLRTALAFTLRGTTRYRLPEAIRRADKLSKGGAPG